MIPSVTATELVAAALRYHRAGRMAEAEALYRRALAADPDTPDALHLLGVLAAQAGREAEAVPLMARALALRPDHPETRLNLGNALRTLGRLDEAATHYRQALASRPDLVEAYTGLGQVLYQGNRLDEAEACYRRALAFRPDDAITHKNLGWTLLKRGELAEGFREYQWRWRIPNFPVKLPPVAQPLWDGGALDGRTILLHAEQGLGDTLQFIRFAPLVRARGAGAVLLACPGELVRLLGGLTALDRILAPGEPWPAFDCHAPLLSLPHLLGTTLETVPAEIPYLAPPPGLAKSWAARLPPAETGLRVGLAWAGNPRHHQPDWAALDRRRSLALHRLAPLAAVPGLHWISLQKDRPPEPSDAPAPGLALFDLMDQVSDLADTAALISGLDLVIGVDTAIVHLAGALGKPVWVLSRFDGCWRWLHNRDDSPWYPTLRLFRQPTPDDWDSVIAAVAVALGLV